MVMEKVPKGSEKFLCELCKYTTVRKSQYERHILTAKHKNVMNCNEKCSKVTAVYSCKNCEKIYKSNVGLWRHLKKCESKPNILNKNTNCIENPIINTTIILDLINKNKELQDLLIQQNKQMQEQCKQHCDLVNKLIEREPINNTINNNTTNNNNQKFNLNFFLNETCKDAMNIQEFIENLKITFQDLLTIGNSGFVSGVSDIFIKKLRDLEIEKRPIHCTDAKRETIYFKEYDAWKKDDKENTKLKNVIEKIEYKNVAALQTWCNENPDSKVNNTTNNLLRDKIYLETLQGDERTRDKIIKNISKEVIIEKEQ
jgi:hypothetical protein